MACDNAAPASPSPASPSPAPLSPAPLSPATLRVGGVEPESIVDGPGLRCVVFVQGCPLRCPGCHNARLQPFEGGREVPVGELLDALADNPLLAGVTLSGGEPFAQAAACAAFARGARDRGLSVWTYTGGRFEDLRDDPAARPLLEASDVLVDGPFVRELRDIDLWFRGSSNQRLIDPRRSLAAGRVVEWAGEA